MIKMICLVGALAAGGAMLHTAYTSPGPLTLSDFTKSADQGVEVAKAAATKTGEVADTVSDAAHTGARALKTTAGVVSDTYDAGARMVGDLRQSITAGLAHEEQPARVLTKAIGGGAAAGASLHPRAAAIDALPEAMVLHDRAASDAAE